ncbi:MAG: hypothetical protein WA919_07445 [Coleofasciculaceae cyanobacterium]
MNTLDMNTLEFLSYLCSLEIKLSVNGERLQQFKDEVSAGYFCKLATLNN